MIGGVYERFLELPLMVVLVAMWLIGGVLLGLCTLALYFAWVLLTREPKRKHRAREETSSKSQRSF